MSNEMMTYQDSQRAMASTTTEMVVSRQAQEVQAAMIVAKRFPRDTTASWNRIIQSCQRKSLAEKAMYEFPRGGESVTGPSIRLAEAMAQAWGNLDFGTIELEQKPGESTVMSYCWDLETNTRQTKIFTVPHVRKTKRGSYPLTDPRDIYEMVANQGARRLRSCILGIIPKDIVDSAVEQCYRTMEQDEEPLVDRVRKMVSVFQKDFGVPQSCLEEYIGCKAEAFTTQSIVRLRSVYTSLKDGRADRESYFNLPKAGGAIEEENKSASTEKKSKKPEPAKEPAVDVATGEVVKEESAKPEQVNLNDL